MNYMDSLEAAISANLNAITGTSPEGYTYYEETGQVDIYDNVLATETSRDDGNQKAVNHVLSWPEEGVQSSLSDTGQSGIDSEVVLTVTSCLFNDGGDPSPKLAIRSRMNNLLDDLIHAMFGGVRSKLGGYAQSLHLAGFAREYAADGNAINSGKLISQWRIVYSQNINNPSTPACG